MENTNRLLKYIILSIIVALSCLAIPKKMMDFIEVASIAVVASATFLILDTYLP
jgi:hypothetical protein